VQTQPEAAGKMGEVGMEVMTRHERQEGEGIMSRDGFPAAPNRHEGRVRCNARRTSATLHAWAMHPRGVNGGSASAISQMLPMP
jgi:hypothetical protein